jgi:hypothetical protein
MVLAIGQTGAAAGGSHGTPAPAATGFNDIEGLDMGVVIFEKAIDLRRRESAPGFHCGV